MPTYEYICSKCGHQFEKSQPISEPALTVCPKEICVKKKWAKGRVKRAISGGGGLLFKGTGFYITDYRSENYRQAAKKDSVPAATNDKPSTPKPDAGSSPATDKKEKKTTPAKTTAT
jgi:putative FmdB family regulatory protein